MDTWLPRSNRLGRLKMVQVLEYYDGPRLLICQNAAGSQFLALWVDEGPDGGMDEWLYVCVSPPRLDQIRRGLIDLHDAFRLAEDNAVLRVDVPHDNGISAVTTVDCDALTEEILPLRGERLSAARHTDSMPKPLRSTKPFPTLHVEAVG